MQRVNKWQLFKQVGYVPHQGQRQVHAALERAQVDQVAVACGVRWGKTMCAAYEMFQEAVQPRKDFMGWCVGPDHDKANIIFDMLFQILKDFLKGQVRYNQGEGLIEFTNLGGGRSRIMRKSASDAMAKGKKGKLTGYAVDMMVIDEASAIEDDSIWENQLRTRLGDRSGKVLMISSARGPRGFFYKLYQIGKARTDPHVYSLRQPTWMNPHYPLEKIRREREQMHPRDFAQEYGAEFVSTTGQVFDEDALIAACCTEPEPYIPGADYFGAQDLASTQDFNVQLIARGPLPTDEVQVSRVVYYDRWNKIPLEHSLDRMQRAFTAYGDCPFYADESGAGEPIVQMMRNRGMMVRGLVWTPKSKNDMVRNMIALVERRALLLPNPAWAPRFFDEAKLYEWQRTPNRSLTTNAPSGVNDDCVASMLMLGKWIRAGGVPIKDQSFTAGDPSDAAQERAASNHRENAGRDLQMRIEGLASPDHPDNIEAFVPRAAPTREGLFRSRMFDPRIL